MKRHMTSILSAAIFAIALPAAAQTAQTAPGENFLTNWDYDGDGTVTIAEVLERRGDLFDGFDTDENGILSAEELADHNAMRDAMQENIERPAQAQQGWANSAGGNGRAGGQGMGRGRQQGWGNAPQQGWGNAPQQGWGNGPQQGWGNGPQQGWGNGPQQGWGNGPQQGWGNAPQQGWGNAPQQGWGNGPQQGQRMGPQGGQGMGPQGGQQQMGAALDTNGDGEISREEFVAAGKAWLPRFDRNGDGVVDASDFATQPQQK